MDLATGLKQHGIESHLGCLLDAGEWAEEADVTGTWVGNLNQRSPLSSLSTLLSLLSYLRSRRIDVIHTHNSHPHKYGAVASLLTGTPLVHTKHGRNWPDNPRWVWLSRQLSRCTQVVVPVSMEIERIVVDIEKVPQRKVVTILNGVDTAQYGGWVRHGEKDCRKEAQKAQKDARSARGIREDAFVIGSVGRLSAEKCYPLLVEAFAGFLKEHPAGFLVIVGEGPERQAVEDAVREHGVGERYLLPGVRSDIAEWLRCFDVFTLTSDQEGTSITLLEAGAGGLPAVVTDVGGNGEVVQNEKTGLVVPSGDAGAIAAAFTKLATDPDLTAQMGAAARERIKSTYSVDSMVDQYVQVYRHAIE